MIPAAAFIAVTAAVLWWMKRTRRLTDPPRRIDRGRHWE